MRLKQLQQKAKSAVPILGIALLVLLAMMPLGVLAQDDSQEDVPQDNYEVTPFDETQDILNQEYYDLVLAVVVEKTKLSEGIFALQRDDTYYLPIRVLAQLFDFYIDEKSSSTSVRGFAVTEEDTFAINLDEKYVEYKGKREALDDLDYVDPSEVAEDIFLAAEVVNQIWPVQLNVDLGALLLRIDPDKKLPFQLALERKRRQENLNNRRQKRIEFVKSVDELPFYATPYQLIGPPAVDVGTEMGFDARADSMRYRVNATGIQDLLYANADYSLSYTHANGQLQKPENLRLRFRRQNIYPNALPLDLEDAQWGDVRIANRDLISPGSSGRGIVFTNDKNNFETEFDEITVDGIARPGWEVELYINDQLINFGVVDETGVYRFEDVVISFGKNEVKVVLYGPQGQLEERTENYFYLSNAVKKGEFVYSGGIVDAERDLIPIEPRDTSRVEGVAANFYGAYGFTKKLTGFFSANTIRDQDVENFKREELRRSYLTAGLIGSVSSTLAQVEFLKDIKGGEAIDARTVSDFKGFKLNARVSGYHDFESPSARSGTNRKTLEYEFNVRKMFRTFIGSLGFDVGTDYTKRESGIDNRGISTRQSLGIKSARFTNTTNTNISDGKHSTTNGRFSTTIRDGNWRFRNNFNYKLFPDVDSSSIQMDLRYGTRKDISYGVSYGQSFDTQEKTVGVQITKDFQNFLGSVEADWSSQSGLGVLMRASTALGPYNADGSYLMRSEPLKNAGPISVLSYLDKDYDGIYSEGDEPVEGTRMQIGSRLGRKETNQHGYLTELNAPLGSKVGVAISKKSVDDPYLVPATDGVAVYPRPGAIQYAELALIETGAVDGTLMYNTGKAVPGLTLEIMNSDAEILQSSITGVDGYFTFERIPPGSYTIRAAPNSGLNVPFKYVDLTPDNLFQFGLSMIVDDLNATPENGLETMVADDGTLSVKNILSIVKGFKENGRFIRNANATSTMAASQKVASVAGARQVRMVRVGKHKDKVRLVMDLTAPIEYMVKQDKINSRFVVDLPNTGWSAKAEYKGGKGSRLRGYYIEPLEGGGTRLILDTAAAAMVGDYGLLKPYKGKKDRFYLDIK